MSRTRLWLFGLTLVAYVAIVVAVVTASPLVTFDWQVMLFRPYKQWPGIHVFLDYFVVLGQRGPTAVLVATWLGWRSWQKGTWRPMLVLGASLLLLNVTVGGAKYGLGRLGPHYATTVGSPELFAGGTIFPSGHTANAVVTWGVLAYLAGARVRRLASVSAALLALAIGITTIYLGTHWVSDVLLGWAAGMLVLLALPWCEPALAAVEEYMFAIWARWRAPAATTVAAAPLPPLAGPRPAEDEPSSPTTVGVGRAQNAVPHQAARPHNARHERTPITPVPSRRPPAERAPRPTPLGQTTRGRGTKG
jgi:membrane-associated phospholipid phosphatase